LSPFLVFGPRIDWQIPGKARPELAYFNRQGLRTREVIGPPMPGEYRVFALGGSTTENVWNDEGVHWPLTLEWALHAAGRTDVRVYNAAMSAYSSAHSLVRLQFDLLQYEPDLVVVMHNVNDLTVNYFAAHAGMAADPNYRAKYGLDRFTGVVRDEDVVLSRLWHSVSVRLRALRQDAPPRLTGEYDLEPGLRAFRSNLRSLAAVARAAGTEVLLLTMPASASRAKYDSVAALGWTGDAGPLPSYERFQRDFDTYNRAILEVGAREGIDVVDMAARFPRDDSLFVDVVHYTAAGIRAFGTILAEALLPRLPPPAGVGADRAPLDRLGAASGRSER
jgi:lysophospholipase L1-like esterase